MLGTLVQYYNLAETTAYEINNQNSYKSGFADAPHYYVRLDSADGIDGYDVTVDTHPIPHAIGERSGDVLRRGKGISLSGVIMADTPTHLEAGAWYLKEMFWEESSERRLTWTPLHDTTQIYVKAYVLNPVSIARNIPQRYDFVTWGWTVGLRCNDPRTRRFSDGAVYPTWQS